MSSPIFPIPTQLATELYNILTTLVESRLSRVNARRSIDATAVAAILTEDRVRQATDSVRLLHAISEADSYLGALEMVKESFGVKIAQGRGMYRAVESLQQCGLLNGVTGAEIELRWHLHSLNAYTATLETDTSKVAELIDMLESARRSNDLTGLSSANDDVRRRFTKIRDDFERMSKELNAAESKLTADTLNEAVAAYVHSVDTKARHDLELTISILEKIESLASVLTPNGWKWIPGVVIFLTSASHRAAEEALEAKQATAYGDGHTKAEVLGEHDKNPFLFVEKVFDQHRANLKLVLNLIGIAGEEIPGWELIKETIGKLVSSYLDARLAEAKRQLAEEPAKGAVAALRHAFEAMRNDLRSTLEEPKFWATVIMTPDEAIRNVTVNTVAHGMITLILDAFPPEPAPTFTGEAIRGQLGELTKALAPAAFFRTGGQPTRDVLHTWVEQATRDERDRPVAQVFSDFQVHDGEVYQWVSIDGEIGALFQNPVRFVRHRDPGCPTPNGTLDALFAAQLPTKDKDGRLVQEVRARDSNLAGGYVHARVNVHGRSLWGTLDVRTAEFVAEEPDETAFASWRNRRITQHGYTDGDRNVTGDWYRPWPDKHFYLFDSNAAHEWARGIDLTGDGIGPNFNIEAALGNRPRYPWPPFPQS